MISRYCGTLLLTFISAHHYIKSVPFGNVKTGGISFFSPLSMFLIARIVLRRTAQARVRFVNCSLFVVFALNRAIYCSTSDISRGIGEPNLGEWLAALITFIMRKGTKNFLVLKLRKKWRLHKQSSCQRCHKWNAPNCFLCSTYGKEALRFLGLSPISFSSSLSKYVCNVIATPKASSSVSAAILQQ